MRRQRITSLQVKNVTHAFEPGHDLIHQLNLDLPLGKVLAVEGSPGSGKSILLKIIAGVVTPTEGDVYYNGMPLKEMSFEEFAPLRSSTSFCFENGGLLMNKTLLENLKLSLVYHNQWRSERNESLLRDLVEHFEIGEFLHLRPASVSAGVRKITGLVRSFLSNAQVLFLDEPSLGIGESATKSLHFWLEKHRRESKDDEVVVVTSSDSRFLSEFHGERFRLDHGILKPVSFKKEAA